MKDENAIATAKAVKDFYAGNAERWMQTYWSNGSSHYWRDDDATCWCLDAVVCKLRSQGKIPDYSMYCFEQVFKRMTGVGLITYNDLKTTTFESMNAVLDQIIALEEVTSAV